MFSKTQSPVKSEIEQQLTDSGKIPDVRTRLASEYTAKFNQLVESGDTDAQAQAVAVLQQIESLFAAPQFVAVKGPGEEVLIRASNAIERTQLQLKGKISSTAFSEQDRYLAAVCGIFENGNCVSSEITVVPLSSPEARASIAIGHPFCAIKFCGDRLLISNCSALESYRLRFEEDRFVAEVSSRVEYHKLALPNYSLDARDMAVSPDGRWLAVQGIELSPGINRHRPLHRVQIYRIEDEGSLSPVRQFGFHDEIRAMSFDGSSENLLFTRTKRTTEEVRNGFILRCLGKEKSVRESVTEVFSKISLADCNLDEYKPDVVLELKRPAKIVLAPAKERGFLTALDDSIMAAGLESGSLVFGRDLSLDLSADLLELRYLKSLPDGRLVTSYLGSNGTFTSQVWNGLNFTIADPYICDTIPRSTFDLRTHDFSSSGRLVAASAVYEAGPGFESIVSVLEI